MTTPSGSSNDEPHLPPRTPGGQQPTVPDGDDPDIGRALDLPFLPSSGSAAPPPAEDPTFDAAAMVEAQKPKIDNPAYADLPAATDESRARARELRAMARRKRTRSKWVARIVLVVIIAGIAVAGYFAYRAYQDDQERRDQEREAPAATEVAEAAEDRVGHWH